jgi:EAL domain-containing protein (putative c-di-GMP-specific phosphodiesterase class I)
MTTPSDEPFSAFLANNAETGDDDFVGAALRAVRSHLGMDVAFVSEFKAGRRYFRQVDAAAKDVPIRAGESDPFDVGYCKFVVDGVLPQLIPDTAEVPAAAAMPVTTAFPIGAHISVPIRLSDGTVYGTFCCFSYSADHSLNNRDLQTIRAFADLAAQRIDRNLTVESQRQQRVAQVRRLFDRGALSIVGQPIYKLATQTIVGFECLSRFAAEPVRSPDRWFSAAADVGLGVELELASVSAAMRDFETVPGEYYLSVNVSPAAVMSGNLLAALANAIPARTMLEVTEHASVEDYQQLRHALEPFRAKGIRLAVDDVGAGFASMRHILSLKPDIIKMDTSLTRDVDSDPGRLAMAAALVTFAERTGCQVVAEGIETDAELKTLRDLGMHYGQGYLLGRPASLRFSVPPGPHSGGTTETAPGSPDEALRPEHPRWAAFLIGEPCPR